MKPSKIAILINMGARQGVAGKLWKKISSDVLELFPANTEIIKYRIPCNIGFVIQDLINDKKVDGFVSAGGDGSLNYILNALINLNKNNSSPYYIGGIGLGSSNDFLKPTRNAIQRIPVKINWKENQLVDIGKVQFNIENGGSITRYFIINASLGITAQANYLFNNPEPYRPLSQGIISKRSVRIVSLSGLILCSGLLIYLNPNNVIFGVLSIIGLATYTYFKKNFWFVGPIYNAWIVALLPIMGYLSISGSNLEGLLNFNLIRICALSFTTYTNFVLIGYLKDISADRATQYKTFPVIFGWNPTVWAGDVIVLICTFFVYSLVVTTIGIVMATVATVIAIAGQLNAHFIKNKKEINASFPIIMTVRSFIIWHMSVMLEVHANWLYLLLIFYLSFELLLYLRPEKSQI